MTSQELLRMMNQLSFHLADVGWLPIPPARVAFQVTESEWLLLQSRLDELQHYVHGLPKDVADMQFYGIRVVKGFAESTPPTQPVSSPGRDSSDPASPGIPEAAPPADPESILGIGSGTLR